MKVIEEKKILLTEEERNLFGKIVFLIDNIYTELEEYGNVCGYNCSLSQLSNIHDTIIESGIIEFDDERQYDFVAS